MMKVLPDELEQREFVVNRALDVRSASMMYLAVSVRHDTTPLGTPGTTPIYICLTRLGKIAKSFFLGDVKITDSKAYLDNCVENYSRAIHDIVCVRMIIEVLELVKGIGSRLESKVDNQQGRLH